MTGGKDETDKVDSSSTVRLGETNLFYSTVLFTQASSRIAGDGQMDGGRDRERSYTGWVDASSRRPLRIWGTVALCQQAGESISLECLIAYLPWPQFFSFSLSLSTFYKYIYLF